MKRKFKTITALVILLALMAGSQAGAVEKEKKYHESWPVNSVQTLDINNKFGEVKVTNKGGNSVTIDVVITVEAANDRIANELLNQLDVRFSKTGSTVFAETHISRGFKSRQRFSIDYEVNIPSDKNLNITNRYGDTFVNVLNASGKFDIQYGNFSANELKAPSGGSVSFSLAYGKANVESANDMDVTVQYSTITLGQVRELNLNSKYAVLNLERASSIVADSKYDNFNFGDVGSVSATTKYTQIRIEKLEKSLKVDAGYGGIRVREVDSRFESVSITNSYGQISLGLGVAAYSLDASCDYCGISFAESRFSGDRVTENQSRRVKGKIGSGNGGTVYIKSRYGQIKLD